jgi:hypothetical protein
MSLTFLQLSDIHFNRRHSKQWDPDESIRNELLLDLPRVAETVGTFSGVLVAGDVAFSGQQREYDDASSYLRKVCEEIGCPEEDVWVVPGNHDVDRSTAGNEVSVGLVQRAVRGTPDGALDDQLEKILGDEETAAQLLRPFTAYNEFATPYGCAVWRDRLFWDERFELDHGYTLNVRGIATSLVSDDLDNENEYRMAVGRAQCRFLRRRGTLNMVLGHHPPVWMRDREVIGDLLDEHAKLQVWGHRHLYRPRVEGGNLVVHVGAVQPDRTEAEWMPRYNVLVLDIVDSSGAAELQLTLHPRRWFGHQFGADADPAGSYPIGLPRVALDPGIVLTVAERHPGRSDVSTVDEQSSDESIAATIDRPLRRLGFRYARLPYQLRLDIARQLNLVDEDIASPSDQELREIACQKARESGKIADLWDAVEARYRDGPVPNPYR